MNKRTFFIAFTVSLGGFLFGFDAGIISGVMEYAGPYLVWMMPRLDGPRVALLHRDVRDAHIRKLSDSIGRKPILIVVAFLYALSAILSAYAVSYEMLYTARMIGGVAFGSALILAPTYIAEIAGAENRGKLVAIQQLNIVLGFFAAFLSNYYFNKYYTGGAEFLTDENVWRWMLGVEALPALLYFVALFFVPKSPRWLFAQNRADEGRQVLKQLHGEEAAAIESAAIEKSLNEEKNIERTSFSELLKPTLRFIIGLGLLIGVLQQATGINAIYFYATSIFKQTGIGTDAAFTQGVLLSFTSVIFTIVAMFTIDRIGRRPLMLFGIGGIAVSLLLCSYGFGQAKYQLSPEKAAEITGVQQEDLAELSSLSFKNDVEFKVK